MVRALLCIWLLLLFLIAAPSIAEKKEKPDFAELKTRDNRTFLQCYVVKQEEDALIFRHAKGMARVSLFDLSSEIQAQYDFDPVVAMKKYKTDLETQRRIRKDLFFQKQKHEAEMAAQADHHRIYQLAEKKWVPVVAEILSLDGQQYALVRARKIVFTPTTVKSTLGLDREGPPKKSMVSFSPHPVFIKQPVYPVSEKKGATWEGYLNPASIGRKTDNGGEDRAVFEAIARKK